MSDFSTFCYYAIVSLAFVYLYMCTFFLACLAIDQKRIDAGRCLMTDVISGFHDDSGISAAAG